MVTLCTSEINMGRGTILMLVEVLLVEVAILCRLIQVTTGEGT